MKPFTGYNPEAYRLANERHYTRIVLWSEAEQTWFGIVPEMPPGCRITNHDNRNEIENMIDDLLLINLHHMLKNGLPIPYAARIEDRLIVDFDKPDAWIESETA